MSKTIWKYLAGVGGRWTQLMPAGAEILSVQAQHGDVQMWALVDANRPSEPREFVAYGTGHPMPNDPGKFIDTFQIENGALIFHVFECT